MCRHVYGCGFNRAVKGRRVDGFAVPGRPVGMDVEHGFVHDRSGRLRECHAADCGGCSRNSEGREPGKLRRPDCVL